MSDIIQRFAHAVRIPIDVVLENIHEYRHKRVVITNTCNTVSVTKTAGGTPIHRRASTDAECFLADDLYLFISPENSIRFQVELSKYWLMVMEAERIK